MRIDDILEIHNDCIVNENRSFIVDVFKKVKGMKWDKAQDFLRGKVKEFFRGLDDNGIDRRQVLDIINKNMWSKFNSTTPIVNKKLTESRLDEGLGDWWKEASTNLYGALSFYPILTSFLELDKVIKGSDDASLRVTAIYFIMWIAIITGKVVSGKLVSKNKKGKVANPVTQEV